MPKRIQLKRSKGWRKPPNTVVVSRPSKWGNPFRVRDFTGLSQPARVYAVKAFQMWLIFPDGFEEDRRKWILDHLHELRGKNLACWCKSGEVCHADVLLRLANREEADDE